MTIYDVTNSRINIFFFLGGGEGPWAQGTETLARPKAIIPLPFRLHSSSRAPTQTTVSFDFDRGYLIFSMVYPLRLIIASFRLVYEYEIEYL